MRKVPSYGTDCLGKAGDDGVGHPDGRAIDPDASDAHPADAGEDRGRDATHSEVVLLVVEGVAVLGDRAKVVVQDVPIDDGLLGASRQPWRHSCYPKCHKTLAGRGAMQGHTSALSRYDTEWMGRLDVVQHHHGRLHRNSEVGTLARTFDKLDQEWMSELPKRPMCLGEVGDGAEVRPKAIASSMLCGWNRVTGGGEGLQ